MRLIDNLQIASGFDPVNMATAANNGDWHRIGLYFKKLLIVFFKAAGAAGEPPTLTLKQATSAAGADAKALNFTRVYTKVGADLAAIGQFTEVIQAAANTYAPAAGDSPAIIAVEISATDLDKNNGFAFVQASVPDVGATAQIGCVLVIGGDPCYIESPAPSILA